MRRYWVFAGAGSHQLLHHNLIMLLSVLNSGLKKRRIPQYCADTGRRPVFPAAEFSGFRRKDSEFGPVEKLNNGYSV
jgi:hypothetical protein